MEDYSFGIIQFSVLRSPLLTRKSRISFLCVLNQLVRINGQRAKLLVFYSCHRSTVTMSFQIFLSAEQHKKLEKMWSEFLAWDEEFTKKTEEQMRKIESFSQPHSSPPITPTPITMPKPQHIKQCHQQNRRVDKQQKYINVGVQHEPAYLDLTNPKHHRTN